MESSLCGGLFPSLRAESHPIFSVPGVKLPDSFLLLCVEVQFLDRYLTIDRSVGNAGKRSGGVPNQDRLSKIRVTEVGITGTSDRAGTCNGTSRWRGGG